MYTDDQLNCIYDKTDGKCHICRKKLSRSNYYSFGRRGAWEVDHSNPGANGGTNKKGIATEFVREENLKNVKEPVRIYHVKVEAAETFEPNTSAAVASSNHIEPSAQKSSSKKKIVIGASVMILMFLGYIFYTQTSNKEPATEGASQPEILDKSIAVLPFNNMSGDPEQEYFCDGMTAQIITNLSHLEPLNVIGLSSVRKFKNSKMTVNEIAIELGVSFVLDGNIRISGDYLRVTAQLMHPGSNFQVWTEEYESRPAFESTTRIFLSTV